MDLRGVLYFFIMLAFFSCREDFESTVSTPQNFQPELIADYEGEVDMVVSSVKGIVVDEESNPLPNAIVVLNNQETVTDQFGHFFYTDTPMNSLGTVVNIELKDFYVGSKLFYPSEGSVENLEITLSAIENPDGLSGLVGEVINLESGITLSIPENAFLHNDQIFEGEVFVSSKSLSSSTDNFDKIIPGNFQTVNSRNERVGLRANQLILLSFVDASGNALNINPAANISLEFPQNIPEGSEAWYYSAEHGLYTINPDRDDNTFLYRHNTPILIASTQNTELSNLSLIASDGVTPLENMEVEVMDENQQTIFRGHSNNQGEITLSTLSEGQARLEVIDACGQIVFTGALFENQELSLEQVDVQTLSGDVYDCEVMPSNNNIIRVAQGDRIQYFYEGGSNFELQLQTCNDGQANIIAIEDPDVSVSSGETINLETINTIGDLFTCEAPSLNQLSLRNTSTGEEFSYPITSTAGGTATSTRFSNFSAVGQEFIISFGGTAIGDYSASGDHSVERIWDDASGFRITGDADQFNVFRYGDQEKITIGRFEGTFENSTTNEIVNIEGNFNFYFQE